jgi:hypothetical protein
MSTVLASEASQTSQAAAVASEPHISSAAAASDAAQATTATTYASAVKANIQQVQVREIIVPATIRKYAPLAEVKFIAPCFGFETLGGTPRAAFQFPHTLPPHNAMVLKACASDAQLYAMQWAAKVVVFPWQEKTWILTEGILPKMTIDEDEFSAKVKWNTESDVNKHTVTRDERQGVPAKLTAFAPPTVTGECIVKMEVENFTSKAGSQSLFKLAHTTAKEKGISLNKLAVNVVHTAQFPKTTRMQDAYYGAVSAGLIGSLYMTRYGYACFLPGMSTLGSKATVDNFAAWVEKHGGKIRERSQGLLTERERTRTPLAVLQVVRNDGARMQGDEIKAIFELLELHLVVSKTKYDEVRGTYIVRSVKGAAMTAIEEETMWTMWSVSLKPLAPRAGAAV